MAATVNRRTVISDELKYFRSAVKATPYLSDLGSDAILTGVVTSRAVNKKVLGKDPVLLPMEFLPKDEDSMWTAGETS